MAILVDYSFLTVAIGTCVLAMATSIIGTISVLTHQSLIGDTLGHASYPGILVSFMVFQSREPWFLFTGAVLAGYVSYYTVHWITAHTKHSYINCLALVSSSFFGLGMVLKQLIQANPNFSKSTQAGLKNYLFGQAAFIQAEDIFWIIGVSIICLILFFRHYQSYKIFLCDEDYAALIGVNTKKLKHLTIFMMICLISVGLKLVGAILISAFLIAPAITGILATRYYSKTLVIALIVGVVSSFIGTYFSSTIKGLSTGPAIICVMTLFAFLAVIFKKRQRG